MNTLRKNLNKANRIVMKIGTSSITHENGNIDLRKIEELARILSDLENSGKEMVLVSSGAIGAGSIQIGLSERPKSTIMKQATAAVGQVILMQMYQKFFSEYNQKIAQVLLTRDVFSSDIKKDNALNSLNALFSLKIIPIINENDVVSTIEIEGDRIGDNDTLSAMVSVLIDADLLIILSDVEGLYDSDPSENKDSSLIPYIDKITEDIYELAGDTENKFGTGGMKTKLDAAKIVASKSIPTVIASSHRINNVYDILDGREVGTLINGVSRKDNK